MELLDPGLSKRPSRFDRKYLFPIPSEEERILYNNYWRNKLKNSDIEFPKKLGPAMAGITEGFSFAYLKEAFVSTLLAIANGRSGTLLDATSSDDDLDDYELWREFKKQVKILRDDMDTSANEDESKIGGLSMTDGGSIAPGPGQLGAVDPETGAAIQLSPIEALKRDMGATGRTHLMPQPSHGANLIGGPMGVFDGRDMLYPDAMFSKECE